ncbi:MAG: glycosyltransferase family 4 protein [Elusimicrobiota bacterium]|jgi:glycosyltransferase involved in cell wall biosynthesis
MNIALVAGSSYADATYRTVFDGLRRAWRSQGHRVRIYTPDVAVPEGLGFPVQDSEDVRVLGSGGAFSCAAGLLSALREDRIDLAHLHFSGVFRPWMIGIPFAAWQRPARWLVSFQDYGHPGLAANGPWRHAGLRLLLRGACRVSAVSGYLRTRVESAFPELRGKVDVVPNGVGLPEGGAAPADPAPHARPYILFVGRLAPYKGADLAVMAFADILRSHPGADLVLCGADFGGGHIALLVEKLGLGGRVRLTGLKTPAQVEALRQGSLFCVAPSREETFGMAVLEAMAAGKAVVAARTGGIPEFARDEENALLFRSGDVKALSAAMRRLLEDEGLRLRLGEAGRGTARAYAWTSIVSRYLRASTGSAAEASAETEESRRDSEGPRSGLGMSPPEKEFAGRVG